MTKNCGTCACFRKPVEKPIPVFGDCMWHLVRMIPYWMHNRYLVLPSWGKGCGAWIPVKKEKKK